MSYSESHIVTLTKPSQRQLQDKVIGNNLNSLIASVQTRSLTVRGWTLEPGQHENSRKPYYQGYTYGTKYAQSQYEYVYTLVLNLTFAREDGKKPEPNELNAIVRTIATRVQQPQFGRWEVTQVDGQEYTIPEDGELNASLDAVGYAPVTMPENWDSFFSHLYGLDSHITRVRRALEAGLMTDWGNRYHCALVGPPGCGKSDICQSIKRALGEEAVMEFDATATTAAGAIKELSEREILPRILLVEEIEKADEKAMSFLLSVLDLRSQIRKTTARNTIVRDTKLFAIATVNDVPLFEKLQAGALASRFANRINFRRPSREHLEMILAREVSRMEGDNAWIAPALDYCETAGINDPRRVTAVCLCGRDMLLDGTYQKLLSETTSEEVN